MKSVHVFVCLAWPDCVHEGAHKHLKMPPVLISSWYKIWMKLVSSTVGGCCKGQHLQFCRLPEIAASWREGCFSHTQMKILTRPKALLLSYQLLNVSMLFCTYKILIMWVIAHGFDYLHFSVYILITLALSWTTIVGS